MKIYFISTNCKVNTPAELVLPHGEKIEIGDICIFSRTHYTNVYWIKRTDLKWRRLPVVCSLDHPINDIPGNTLLYSYNGFDKRKGELNLISIIRTYFMGDNLLSSLLDEVSSILKYKKDLIDVGLLKRIYSTNTMNSNVLNQSFSSLAVKERVLPKMGFIDFLSPNLRIELEELLKRQNPKEAINLLRSRHSVEFRQAFKKFIRLFPLRSIYEGLG